MPAWPNLLRSFCELAILFQYCCLSIRSLSGMCHIVHWSFSAFSISCAVLVIHSSFALTTATLTFLWCLRNSLRLVTAGSSNDVLCFLALSIVEAFLYSLQASQAWFSLLVQLSPPLISKVLQCLPIMLSCTFRAMWWLQQLLCQVLSVSILEWWAAQQVSSKRHKWTVFTLPWGVDFNP